MKTTFYLVLLLLIWSCDASENNNGGDTTEDDSIPPISDSLKHKNQQLPKGVSFRGKRVDAYKWQDANGENFIIVSEYKSLKGKEIDMEDENWTIDQFPDYSEMCMQSYRKTASGVSQILNICDTSTLPSP